KFPKQNKFIQRLKALIFSKQNRLNESKTIYQGLCKNPKADWWLLREYALVLLELKETESAIKVLCQGALNCYKIDSMVNLLCDLGNICKGSGQPQQALEHYLLSRVIRTENKWNVSSELEGEIIRIKKEIGEDIITEDKRELLNKCKKYWLEKTVVDGETDRRAPIKGVVGIIDIREDGKAFCFVKTVNGEAVFCFKKDLPKDIKNGQNVIFTKQPSFDMKKNKQSWKAINITIGD
ncbi:MAG: hypothetical protein Q7W05_02310, partial [Deltaproteobacteria bacterium]|nr:hypothetical protein [Deltaproteobacteria bacterium]